MMPDTLKRKRIGVLPSHSDARPDIMDFLIQLEESNAIECVVFRKSMENATSANERELLGHRGSFYFKLIRNLYSRFGELPKSKQNFLITELFKLSSATGLKKKLNEWRLYIRSINRLPIPLKWYHRLICNVDKSEISDIDAFLLISEISDDALVSRISSLKKPVYLYVYSWDHPCKHTNLPNNLTGYFVWNTQVKNDLISLCGVPKENIHIVGATQLAGLKEFLDLPTSDKDLKTNAELTIYFGSAVGTLELAKEEAKFVELVYKICCEINQPFQIIFRPYPFLANWSIYDSLKALPHISFDIWERNDGDDWRTMSRQVIHHRNQMLNNADIFIHMGTTMGLEACFFDTPSVLIDAGTKSKFREIKPSQMMQNFCDQYHLNQHMKFEKSPNVIRTEEELQQLLKIAFNPETKGQLVKYNNWVRKDTELKSLTEIADTVIAALNKQQ